MARTPNDDIQGHSDSNAGNNAQTIEANGQDTIDVPSTDFVADAEMTREGHDLVLEAPDGSTLVIEGYFTADPAPVLESPDGAVLTPELVDSFVHSPMQFASNGGMVDVSPVGAIEEVTGEATVTRADGSIETITIGTPIYEGDIVETDGAGAVNIVFIDETSFAVSENARLAVDEYVFDPATESGTSNFSVLRGVFVFTSGLIGRDDPDDVEIDTPVGSIGIRGTIIAGNIVPGGDTEITVIEGAIVIRNGVGEQTLSSQFESVRLGGFNDNMEDMGVLDAQDVSDKFGSVSSVAPTLFSAINDAANDQAGDAQAGGEAGDVAEGEGEGDIAGQNPQNVEAGPEGEVGPEGDVAPVEETLELETQTEDPLLQDDPLLDPLNTELEGDLGLQFDDGSTDSTFDGTQPLLDRSTSTNDDGGTNEPIFNQTADEPLAPQTNNTTTSDVNDPFTITSLGTRLFGGGDVNLNSKGIAIAEIRVEDLDGKGTSFGRHQLQDVRIGGTPVGIDNFDLVRDPQTPAGVHKYILKLKDGLDLGALTQTTGALDVTLVDDNGNGFTANTTVTGSISNNNTLHVDQLGGENGFVIRGTGTGNFGSSMTALDHNGDGRMDLLIGDSEQARAFLLTNPGTGQVGHEINVLDANPQIFGPGNVQADPAGSGFGASVSNLGDLDNDGEDDFIVGSPGLSKPGQGINGGTAVVYRSNDPTADDVKQTTTGAEAGAVVAGLGDINNDGFEDFAVTFANEGKVQVFFGQGGGFKTDSTNFFASGADGFIITADDGLSNTDILGLTVDNIGDFNADGIDDFIVSANGYDADGGAIKEGVAFVVLGKSGTDNDLNDTSENTLDLNTTQATANNYLIFQTPDAGANAQNISVASAGDFNGDGIADIAVSDIEASSGKGEVFVSFGGGTYTGVNDLNTVAGTADGIKITGANLGSFAGSSIAGIGDFNGDGMDDLAIASEAEGKVYVVYGDNASTNVNLGALSPSQGLVIDLHEGGGSGSLGPINLSGGDDLDGDGFSDLVIGVENGGINNQGSVFVVNGGDYEGLEGGLMEIGTDGDDTAMNANADNEILIGGLGNDVMSDGNNNDVIFRGGADNDTIILNNQNFKDIDGGAGFGDTIEWNGAGTLDLSQATGANVGAEQISGIEKLEFAQDNQTITLSVENIFNMLKTSDNGTLQILGGGNNNLQLNIDGTIPSSIASDSDVEFALQDIASNANSTGNDGTFFNFSIGGYTLQIDNTLVTGGDVAII